jgi:hypothetical protein
MSGYFIFDIALAVINLAFVILNIVTGRRATALFNAVAMVAITYTAFHLVSR